MLFNDESVLYLSCDGSGGMYTCQNSLNLRFYYIKPVTLI